MPESFVKNFKPVFGTFKGHPKRLDIRGVFKPYGTIPLPTFITNLRIKSRLTFTFDIGEYIGRITFVDAKIIGYSEVIFWNKSTNQKFVYHSVMGMRKRFIPHNLESASTSSYSKKRYTRISWDRSHGKFSVVFDLNGDSVRPSAHGAISGDFNAEQFAEQIQRSEDVPPCTTVRSQPTEQFHCAIKTVSRKPCPTVPVFQIFRFQEHI